MKKRQIGLLGLAIGQAVTIIAKDKTLRKHVEATPGILPKLKLIGTKWRDTNKGLAQEVKEKAKDWNRDTGMDSLKADFEHDSNSLQTRWEQQQEKDRKKEGEDGVRKILDKAPDQKTLEETVGKYKQKIKDRRDTI